MADPIRVQVGSRIVEFPAGTDPTAMAAALKNLPPDEETAAHIAQTGLDSEFGPTKDKPFLQNLAESDVFQSAAHPRSVGDFLSLALPSIGLSSIVPERAAATLAPAVTKTGQGLSALGKAATPASLPIAVTDAMVRGKPLESATIATAPYAARGAGNILQRVGNWMGQERGIGERGVDWENRARQSILEHPPATTTPTPPTAAARPTALPTAPPTSVAAASADDITHNALLHNLKGPTEPIPLGPSSLDVPPSRQLSRSPVESWLSLDNPEWHSGADISTAEGRSARALHAREGEMNADYVRRLADPRGDITPAAAATTGTIAALIQRFLGKPTPPPTPLRGPTGDIVLPSASSNNDLDVLARFAHGPGQVSTTVR